MTGIYRTDYKNNYWLSRLSESWCRLCFILHLGHHRTHRKIILGHQQFLPAKERLRTKCNGLHTQNRLKKRIFLEEAWPRKRSLCYDLNDGMTVSGGADIYSCFKFDFIAVMFREEIAFYIVRRSNHVSNDVLIDARTSQLAYVCFVEKASFCNYELEHVKELR